MSLVEFSISWLWTTWVKDIWWHFFLKKWYLQRLDTKPTITSFWSFLKHFKLGVTTWKVASIRSSLLPTTTTYVTLWAPKTWAPGKFVRLNTCQDMIFWSIIVQTKLIEPLKFSHNIFCGTLNKKPSSKPKTWKFCIAWSHPWSKYLALW